jgi:hypothetical protein
MLLFYHEAAERRNKVNNELRNETNFCNSPDDIRHCHSRWITKSRAIPGRKDLTGNQRLHAIQAERKGQSSEFIVIFEPLTFKQKAIPEPNHRNDRGCFKYDRICLSSTGSKPTSPLSTHQSRPNRKHCWAHPIRRHMRTR